MHVESEIAERVPGLVTLLRDKPALTLVEAAYLAAMSPAGVHRAISAGELVTAGRGRILREDLERYLRAMRRGRE